MSRLTLRIDTAVFGRRILFLLVLASLTLGNLFTLFRGLSSPEAMDQAQIAREIARGNWFTTKFIRPNAYERAKQHQNGSAVPLVKFQDTYHSPLNPLLNSVVLKVVGAEDSARWKMGENEMVYPLDRVIAAVSTTCFLLSIGVSYLLISRIFDPKIAGVTAILMLLCETFWDYALSGLPQMLMLLLFSCAMYFAYRAVEESSEGRAPFASAIIAGLFFTLLALAHYLAIWIAIGYIIFAALAFRPRGVVGVSVFATLAIALALVMVRNAGLTGSPFGTAFLNLYNGIGGGNEDLVMRTSDPQSHSLIRKSFFLDLIRASLLQTTSLIPFLAGIIIAPVFFLSLLHPFKTASIANFRWAILTMFAISAFGLSIFGVSTDKLDPNQTHLLFAPVMAAYGLAFLSILWAKIPAVVNEPVFRNLHHFAIIIISGLPLLINLPSQVKMGLHRKDRGGIPHWPPYYAPALNLGVSNWITKTQICFSDQPWAVAWYADRISVWIPPSIEDFTDIERSASDLKTPVVGILISPSSHGSGNAAEVAAKYKDFTSLVMDGPTVAATYPPGISIYDKDQKIQDILRRYPHRTNLFGRLDMAYYSGSAPQTVAGAQ